MGGMDPDAGGGPGVAAIRERHERLLRHLRDVAAVNGHDPHRLRIVAVTKTHPLEVAAAALEAGVTLLGESRVQEAEPKIRALPAAEWHFVGRLQSNKARRAARAFAMIHSVESVALLRQLRELGTEEARSPRLLLQVNATGEPTKAGMPPEDLLSAETVAAVREAGITVTGLMTIAPMGSTHEEARATFRRLRELRDTLREDAGIGLPELSMGMSADADAAAAEGATLVRIGTALFGPRE